MKGQKADNIYINLRFDPSEYGPDPSQANINSTLTQSIIDNPSDYYCSIIRFRIPTDQIPMYRFRIDPTQNMANVSDLRIGVRLGASLQTTRLLYVPSNIGLTPPVTQAVTSPFWTVEQLNNPYYHCYSVDVLLNAFNTAIATSIAAGGWVVPAPYFVYDSSSELISVIVDNAFIAGGYSLYINALSKTYLAGFPFIFNKLDTNFDKYYFKFGVLPYLGVSPYQFVQEKNTMSNWFDLQKIIITSNSLPTRGENSPDNSSGLSNNVPILTDFEVGFDSLNMSTSDIIYNPIACYRLCDLTSNSSLNKIDLGFYYQSKDGTVHPIFLSANESLSVKLGFFKKSLYNND